MTSYSGIMKLGHRRTCRLCEATVVGSVGVGNRRGSTLRRRRGAEVRGKEGETGEMLGGGKE